MGETTQIGWVGPNGKTFNGWEGCSEVSAGCVHCYARVRAERFKHDLWGDGKPRRRTSVQNWHLPEKWNKEAGQPENLVCLVCGATKDHGMNAEGYCEQCELKGNPQRVFVFSASLSDWLDPLVEIEWFIDLMDLVRRTKNLTWLMLTKRPEQWENRLLDAMASLEAHLMAQTTGGTKPLQGRDLDLELTHDWLAAWYSGDAPFNVWVGTTTENQKMADKRIPILFDIPAAIRFLSCEPLLTAIDLTPWIGVGHIAGTTNPCNADSEGGPCLQSGWGEVAKFWVIVGGESGKGARPTNMAWARSLRDQCQAANVAFFFKQVGGEGRDAKDHDRIPADLQIQDWPA